ncbi:TPA: hypothetical protein ACH3X2_010274 [Trebouxia sp. C0005]
MEAHTPTAELASSYENPSTSIPPSIDEYHPLQSIQYLIQGGTPTDHGVPEQQRPGAESSMPAHSRIQSLSEIQFEEGLTIQQYAAQLMHLLHHSANGADSLARAPLIEYLKQQADEQPSNGNPHDTIVWQLTDDAAVGQAMQECIQQPGFGQETDAVCSWFYDWYRSDDPLLQRFVARFAPDIARRFMFHCLSTSETDPVPGLEACLVAIFEVKSSSPDVFRLPDLSQPSVHHDPVPFHTGKAGSSQGLVRQQSSLTPVSPTYSILPAGVAALFGSSAKLGHAKVLSGVRSWQRNAVAGAALQCFCSWMVTFSDAVITRFAGLALSLAAAGCPWLQAEAQHVLQEQLQLGSQAQTLHSPRPSATPRLQLSADVVDPLCHGLGHAIFRLALKMQQRPQSPTLSHTDLGAGTDSSAAQQSSMSSFNVEQSLGTVAEAVAGLHVRTTYDLTAEGVLLTQSLLAQLHQLYHPVQALPSASRPLL